MPSRNATKNYIENGYYHIYNRGVEKRIIFLDEHDYGVFLSYLKEYLLPKNENQNIKRIMEPGISSKERQRILELLSRNNFFQEINLLAYCLMPNHFHFFVKQKSKGAIDKFMNSLGTRYSMYFNRRYKRVGGLYQDVYKAALVQTSEHFLHLSRYIHKQASEINANQPCSLPEYLGTRTTSWIATEEILSTFSEDENAYDLYRQFMIDDDNLDDPAIPTLEDE